MHCYGFIYKVSLSDLVQEQNAGLTVCVCVYIRFIISFHLEKAQSGRVALL